MPRQARNIKKNKMYHIMVQGINREYIFKNIKNKNRYLNLLREKLGEYNSIVVAYCIMDNHGHFFMCSENDKDISKLFQRVNGAYSNYYNKVNNRVGYVFRDRFLSKEIFDDIQKMKCIHYIHNNPVKAKIVAKVEDYLYSSYCEYQKRESDIIDFNIVSRIVNLEEVLIYVEKDENFEDVSLEVDEFDKDLFENGYLTSVNIGELKQDKTLLKQEIKNCKLELHVPVKELSRVFEIPIKTIYRWLQK